MLISKANRVYSFRMNMMEEIFSDMMLCKNSWRMISKSTQLISVCSTVDKESQGIHTGASSSFNR